MFVDSLAREPRHRSVECGSPRQGAPDRPKVRSPASDPSRPYATSDPHQPSCGEDSTRNGSLPTSFASVSRLSFHRFARSFPHSPQAHNSTPSFSASCAPLVPSSAPERKSTPLLSCACALFRENIGGTQNSHRPLSQSNLFNKRGNASAPAGTGKAKHSKKSPEVHYNQSGKRILGSRNRPRE